MKPMDEQLQRAFIDTMREYVTGEPSASRAAFGWLLGCRAALCMSDAITADMHILMCRMTDAAIDARHYIIKTMRMTP